MQDFREISNLYCSGIGPGSFGGTTGEFLQKEGREEGRKGGGREGERGEGRDRGRERRKRKKEGKILIRV